MPCRIRLCRASILAATVVLSACHGGGGSKNHAGGPPTQIDLTVTAFQVSPSAADAQDTLLLTGTIQNIGTETANPLNGDKFQVRFNLSTDGTLELNEVGFLNVDVSEPIPPGGSFSFSGRMGDGDTLLRFGNFCEPCSTPPCLCVPPQTGVLGVKVDSADDIAELNEANNFKFIPIEVIGTRVSAANRGCNAGTVGGMVGGDGCDLKFLDNVDTANAQHRPCTPGVCTPTDQMFPNELHTDITMILTIRGCQGGSCGGAWEVTATKDKSGQVTTFSHILSCSTNGSATDAVCVWSWDLINDRLCTEPGHICV